MTISPEAFDTARSILHPALFPTTYNYEQVIEKVATALQAKRDAAVPKLPDDLAGLVERLESHMGRQEVAVLLADCRTAAATIQSLAARNAELEMGLEDLLSWFPDKPSEPEWRIKAGNYGADAAVSIARSLLNKDRQP